MVFGISIGSSSVCSAVCTNNRCTVVANAGGEHRPRAVVAKVENDLVVGGGGGKNAAAFTNILGQFETEGPVHTMQQQVST